MLPNASRAEDAAAVTNAESVHSLSTIAAYGIALDELHDGSAPLALYGAYAGANGEPRGCITPPRTAAFRW